MDLLGGPLTTRLIQTGCKFTIEPYPSGWFGCIHDLDRQFGNGSVWTLTWTQSDGPELLLILSVWETGPFYVSDTGEEIVDLVYTILLYPGLMIKVFSDRAIGYMVEEDNRLHELLNVNTTLVK